MSFVLQVTRPDLIECFRSPLYAERVILYLGQPGNGLFPQPEEGRLSGFQPIVHILDSIWIDVHFVEFCTFMFDKTAAIFP